MIVHVKLMASLRSKLPPNAQKGIAQLDLPDGATVATVLDQLGLAAGQVHVVMVNDAMEPDRQRGLADGDALVILPLWPAVLKPVDSCSPVRFAEELHATEKVVNSRSELTTFRERSSL